MEAIATKKTRAAAQPSIPQALIYEIMDGKPIYRRGYRDVLNHTKTIEEIMGASSLQSAILDYLLSIIYANFDRSRYRIFTGEPGLHIGKNQNFACDILIYDKKTLPGHLISHKYADVPAEIAIEIDVDADTSDRSDWEYISAKTASLLRFGIKKVIWIFTLNEQVLIAAPGSDWLTRSWQKDVEIAPGVAFNISDLLRSENISPR